jgi:hypothetical protein
LKIARLLIVLYAALCVVALWFIPASVHGWMGVAPDPLSAVLAMLLALPWTFLLRFVPDAGPWAAAALLAACMAINVWLLWRLLRWWETSRDVGRKRA